MKCLETNHYVLSTALIAGTVAFSAGPALASGGHGAYVYANNPKSASYTPDKNYSANPGGEINIKRSGVGRYAVRFDGIMAKKRSGGNVQVSAYGPGSESCKVEGWSSGNGGFTAKIRCFSANGKPVDTRYTVMVTAHAPAHAPVGFAWANNPTAKKYNADGNYAHSPGGAVMISHAGTGRYDVKFAGLGGKANRGGQVQVTAYGPGSEHCKIERWSVGSGHLTATIRCFNSSGKPADSRFSVFAMGPK